jgi:hypothetical protein
VLALLEPAQGGRGHSTVLDKDLAAIGGGRRHYFIDIVGGTVVAILAIAAANWCRRACAASEMAVEIGEPGLVRIQ